MTSDLATRQCKHTKHHCRDARRRHGPCDTASPHARQRFCCLSAPRIFGLRTPMEKRQLRSLEFVAGFVARWCTAVCP